MRKIEKKQALVIGGGISGLLAARVLVDHFDQIIILERDHYSKEAGFRPGVPQGRQAHTLLLKGQEILSTMFPQLHAHLIQKGALQYDHGSAIYYYGGYCQAPAHLDGWLCSRLLLEWQLRQELLEMYPQIQFIEGSEVTNLLYDASSDAVIGVQYRKRNPIASQEREKLFAHFVIDTSGFSSQAPQWLKELGFSAPAETLVEASLGYASRFFYQSSAESADKLIAIQTTGTSKRGGVLMAIEGGQWLVVLAGVHGDYPSQKDDDYLAFAKSLPDQRLYEAIKDARKATPAYGYRYLASRRRHYERLKRSPKNFVIMGDAACSFNPIYGQGITVAILEACALERCLKRPHRNLARHFQRIVARTTNMPWLLATISDSATHKLARQYIERLIEILPGNPQIFLIFLRVVHMLDSPIALFSPRILWKVISSKKRVEITHSDEYTTAAHRRSLLENVLGDK